MWKKLSFGEPALEMLLFIDSAVYSKADECLPNHRQTCREGYRLQSQRALVETKARAKRRVNTE